VGGETRDTRPKVKFGGREARFRRWNAMFTVADMFGKVGAYGSKGEKAGI
jgi:hypothetical protein